MAAASFKYALSRWEMKPEVVHGEKTDIQPSSSSQRSSWRPSAAWLGPWRSRTCTFSRTCRLNAFVSFARISRKRFSDNGNQRAQVADIARLSKGAAKLKRARDILQKSLGSLREGVDVKFGFVAKHRGVCPVNLSASRLVSRGVASTSGYQGPGAGAASAMKS